MHNDNKIINNFEKIERLCRDRGELYGYERLLKRKNLDEDIYKIISGRITHLEKCNVSKGN